MVSTVVGGIGTSIRHNQMEHIGRWRSRRLSFPRQLSFRSSLVDEYRTPRFDS